MDTFNGKVLVIGATGKVGQNVVKELRARDILVRAMVRSLDSVSKDGKENPAAAPPTDFFTDKVGRSPLLVSDSGVEVVQGDVTDKAAVCRAAEGVAAIIDVHGVAPLRFSRFSDLWHDPEADPMHPAAVNFGGVKNVIAACKQHGVKHLVRLTGLSVAMPAWNPVVMIFNGLLSCTVKWHRRSEMLIRESGIAYTVVQPSGLRDGPQASEAGSLLLLQCEAASPMTTVPPKTGISRLDVASLCVMALCCKSCKNTTLRCASLPKDTAAPSGVQSSSEWPPLVASVVSDTSVLQDQNYVMYSTIGVGIFASVLAGVGIGVVKVVQLAVHALF